MVQVNKKLLLILAVVLALLLVSQIVKAISAPKFFANCAEAKVAHRSNIPKGDPYYRAGLDRNLNGFACE